MSPRQITLPEAVTTAAEGTTGCCGRVGKKTAGPRGGALVGREERWKGKRPAPRAPAA